MSEALERVPFQLAISDPDLLKAPWEILSLPQQVTLKVMYGLPLAGRELAIWSAFQGAGIYDELGYLLKIDHPVAYQPKEYEIFSGIFGRRSGKSDKIGGFAAAYEITLGGHTQFIAKKQDCYWLYVAQDLGVAQSNMKFILSTLAMSPLLSQEIINPEKPGIEEVKFKNGIILSAQPPSIKTSRGAAVCGVTMDELGFWYKDAKSANPDKQVVIAIDYAMQQFEHAKQFRFSTPWTKEGLLYEAYMAGTDGSRIHCPSCAAGSNCPHVKDERDEYEDHLVVQGPTALMEVPEPLVTRKKLARKRKRDPEAFTRESLAQFIDSQTSFLTHASVDQAIEAGNKGPRSFIDGANYVVAIDPAFRRDSFTCTVTHNDSELGVVQDEVWEEEPLPGERLNPALMLDKVKLTLDFWQTNLVYSDQYHLESLQQLALDRDFVIFGIDLTAKSKSNIMLNMSTLLNHKRLKLLDQPVQTRQLKDLQKILGPNNYMSVAAPPGKHDDLATVLALCASQAIHLPGLEPAERKRAEPRNSEIVSREAILEDLRESWDRERPYNEELQRQTEHLDYLLAVSEDS